MIFAGKLQKVVFLWRRSEKGVFCDFYSTSQKSGVKFLSSSDWSTTNGEVAQLFEESAKTTQVASFFLKKYRFSPKVLKKKQVFFWFLDKRHD